MHITTIGLDIAKSVFQVHAVDDETGEIARRQLRRGAMLSFFGRLDRCVIGLEACGTAHYWARELSALGHEVRLVPPSYVKPYAKRGKKNDAVDAEAIWEAMSRPTMQYVPIKTVEQQAALVPHRVRDLALRHRVALVNSLRSLMAEFGVVAPKGRQGVAELAAVLRDEEDDRIPASSRSMLLEMVGMIEGLAAPIEATEKAIEAAAKGDETARLLMSVPGIGPITASALSALVGDPSRFRDGRHFAAWLGLVASQHSTGGKTRLGRITKRGDRYLRKLLVMGATANLRTAKRGRTPLAGWTRRLLGRRPGRMVSVALANKTARIAWAVMAKREPYRPELAAANAAQLKAA